MAFWDNILQNDLFWANIHTMLKGQKLVPEMFRKFSIFQDLRTSKGNNWIKVYLNSNTRGLLSSKPAAAHYYWQNLTMVDQKYYPNRHIITLQEVRFQMINMFLFILIVMEILLLCTVYFLRFTKNNAFSKLLKAMPANWRSTLWITCFSMEIMGSFRCILKNLLLNWIIYRLKM